MQNNTIRFWTRRRIELVRDLLNDLENGKPGPMQIAQRAMRPVLPKRFYKDVTVGEAEGGFAVLLDGKIAKTPAQQPLVLPKRAIAEAVAAEWAAPERDIHPSKMPLTRLANLAIDRVATEAIGIAEEIVHYASSDHVLYRAAEPKDLVAAQSKNWDPIVNWARDDLGANFALAEGINYVSQPESALASVRKEVGRYPPPFALAALASATQLAGSVLIALMLALGKLNAEQAWVAAHVDEDWNIAGWGEDLEAAQRRAARWSEFQAAAKMLALL
jgi:chaperone required for assembly of F1-ATPase